MAMVNQMRKIVISVQQQGKMNYRQRISIYPNRYQSVAEFIDIISMELKTQQGEPMILSPQTKISLLDTNSGDYVQLTDAMLPQIKDRSRIRIERTRLEKIHDYFEDHNRQLEMNAPMRELFEYHAKIVCFLSKHVASGTQISAQELQQAETTDAVSAKTLVDQLKEMEGGAALRVLTQMSVNQGKAEREFTEEDTVRRLRKEVAAYKLRVERLEKDLSRTLTAAEQLQGQIHTNASEKEEEMTRLRQEVVTLRRLTGEQQNELAGTKRQLQTIERDRAQLKTKNDHLSSQIAVLAESQTQPIGRGGQLRIEDRPTTAPHAAKAFLAAHGIGRDSGATPKWGARPNRNFLAKSPRAGKTPKAGSRKSRLGGLSPRHSPNVSNLPSPMNRSRHEGDTPNEAVPPLLLDGSQASNLVSKAATSDTDQSGPDSGDDRNSPLQNIEGSPRQRSFHRNKGTKLVERQVVVQFVDADGEFVSTTATLTSNDALSIHQTYGTIVKSLLDANVRAVSTRHLRMHYFRYGKKYVIKEDEDVQSFYGYDGQLLLNCVEEEMGAMVEMNSGINTGRDQYNYSRVGSFGRMQSWTRRASLDGTARRGSLGSTMVEEESDDSAAASTNMSPYGSFRSRPGVPSRSNLHTAPAKVKKDKSRGIFEPTPSSALFAHGANSSLPTDSDIEEIFIKLGGTADGGVQFDAVQEYLAKSFDDLGDPGRFARVLQPYRKAGKDMRMEDLTMVLLRLAKE